MLVSTAFRELLHAQANVKTDDTPEQEKADAAIMRVVDDPLAAGSIILALASFAIFSIMERPGTEPPEQGIEVLTGAGEEPIEHFSELLYSILAGYRAGEEQGIGIKSMMIAKQITADRELCALVIWVLATFVTLEYERGSGDIAEGLDRLVDSCIRQQLITSDELRTN